MWHMEVPSLWVKSELQLLAYATATAMWDLRRVCDLHHSSQQCWILNPLSETWDRTYILVDTHFRSAATGTPYPEVFLIAFPLEDFVTNKMGSQIIWSA